MRTPPLLLLLLTLSLAPGVSALFLGDFVKGLIGWILTLFGALFGVQEPSAPSGDLIVAFDDNLTEEQVEYEAHALANRTGGTVRYLYKHVIKGAYIEGMAAQAYSLEVPASKEASSPRSSTITYSPNQIITDEQLLRTQLTPPIGLDRIDQRDLPLDDAYRYRYDGAGVNLYIMDSGIWVGHNEFSGRNVTCGYTAFATFRGCEDMRGHGSHVAGTAAGETFGVAKGADIIAVKILDSRGEGTFAGMIAGLDYVAGEKKANPELPMVINLSVAGPKSNLANKAANNAVDLGIVIVTAAGNYGNNACSGYSPASADNVITVGASESTANTERRAEYSNYGSCVDVFAPGTGIASVSTAHKTYTTTKDGTSMSAAHVAGAVALYLERDPLMSPYEVRNALIDNSSKGKLTSSHLDSPNRILNTNFD